MAEPSIRIDPGLRVNNESVKGGINNIPPDKRHTIVNGKIVKPKTKQPKVKSSISIDAGLLRKR